MRKNRLADSKWSPEIRLECMSSRRFFHLFNGGDRPRNSGVVDEKSIPPSSAITRETTLAISSRAVQSFECRQTRDEREFYDIQSQELTPSV